MPELIGWTYSVHFCAVFSNILQATGTEVSFVGSDVGLPDHVKFGRCKSNHSRLSIYMAYRRTDYAIHHFERKLNSVSLTKYMWCQTVHIWKD